MTGRHPPPAIFAPAIGPAPLDHGRLGCHQPIDGPRVRRDSLKSRHDNTIHYKVYCKQINYFE